MSKVNIFLVGAQKAGTTSLYNWLSQHPDIQAPQETKDYHFFSLELEFNKGYQHFEKPYKNKNQLIKLHSGVNYLYNHEICAKRIYEYNPDAKIIISIRNPISRAISAHKYFTRTLRENNTFDVALQLEKNNEIKGLDKNNLTYIEHGKYLNQIKEFHKYFPPENVKIVIFEEMMNKEKRHDIMNELLVFMNASHFNFNFSHLNKSGEPRLKWINLLIRGQYKFKKIAKIIPLNLRRNLLKKIEEKNISDTKIKTNISKSTLQHLENEFQEEISKLSEYLKTDLLSYWQSSENSFN